jgi:hypothetical protein
MDLIAAFESKTKKFAAKGQSAAINRQIARHRGASRPFLFHRMAIIAAEMEGTWASPNFR